MAEVAPTTKNPADAVAGHLPQNNSADPLGLSPMKNTDDLERRAALPDPMAGTPGSLGRTEPVSEDETDKDNEDALAVDEDGNAKHPAKTPLDSHPPLRPGDRIQGPHDRKNRRPTKEELEAGENALALNLTREEELQMMEQAGVIKDPPIEKNAPKDKPANMREVMESRGIKFAKPEETENDEPAKGKDNAERERDLVDSEAKAKNE